MNAMQLLSTRASNGKLQDPAPAPDVLDQIIEAALRAPDHAALRPWRILVLRGEARERLGDVLADAERARAPKVSEEKLARTRRKPLRAPLMLVVVAEVREHPKAPEVEQLLSAGCVAYGILLGLHAHGFAGVWKTGAAAYDPLVKEGLGVRPEHHIVGFLYAGTPAQDAPKVPRPKAGDHMVEWTG